MGLRNLSWASEGRRGSHTLNVLPMQNRNVLLKRTPRGETEGRRGQAEAGHAEARVVATSLCEVWAQAAASTNLHSHLPCVSFPQVISSVISPLCCCTSSMEEGSPPLAWMSVLDFKVRNEADNTTPLQRVERQQDLQKATCPSSA